jgi:hypothetical protein
MIDWRVFSAPNSEGRCTVVEDDDTLVICKVDDAMRIMLIGRGYLARREFTSGATRLESDGRTFGRGVVEPRRSCLYGQARSVSPTTIDPGGDQDGAWLGYWY